MRLCPSVGGLGSGIESGDSEGCGSNAVVSSDPPPPTYLGVQQFFRFCERDSAERKALLRRGIELLFTDVLEQLESLPVLNPSRKENIVTELRQLSDTPSTKNSLQIDDFLAAEENTSFMQALLHFSYRVATFTLLKGLLLESWRRADLFGDLLIVELMRNSSLSISRLLSQTSGNHNLVCGKNRWLLPTQNNYSWYTSGEATILSISPLLSKILESDEEESGSIEAIDELLASHQQVADPNSCLMRIIPPFFSGWLWSHILDSLPGRAEELIRKLGPKVSPKIVFDPYARSGELLIEPVLRWKEISIEKGIFLLEAGINAIFGCERDFFLRSFAEAKLLIAATPILAARRRGERRMPPPSLSSGVISYDPLALLESALPLLSPAPLGPPGQDPPAAIVHSLKELCKGDFCVTAFPEDHEVSHLELLIRDFPFWKSVADQQLDPPFWLYLLGLSKLREGGILAFASNLYWPTLPAAKALRQYVLENARVLQIIDLGPLPATLPRYLFILARCNNASERATHKLQILRSRSQILPTAPALAAHLHRISQIARLVQTPGETLQDNDLEVYFSAPCQGELGSEPWMNLDEGGHHQIIQMINRQATTLGDLFTLQRFTKGEEEKARPLTLWDRPQLPAEGILQVPYCSERWSCYLNSASLSDFPENHSKAHWNLLKKPNVRESIFYSYALLGSRVARFWIDQASSTLGGMRIFEGKQISAIPMRPIRWESERENPVRNEKLGRIRNALGASDFEFLKASLSLEIECGREELVHDALSLMGEEILTLNSRLSKYSALFQCEAKRFCKIEAKEKFPSQTHAPSLMKILPPRKVIPLAQHPEIYKDLPKGLKPERFCLSQFRREEGIKCEGAHLALLSQQSEIIKLYGPPLFLDLIEEALPSYAHHFFDEIAEAISLPPSHEEFLAIREQLASHCCNIIERRQRFWEVINSLCYQLYGFPPTDPTLSLMEGK